MGFFCIFSFMFILSLQAQRFGHGGGGGNMGGGGGGRPDNGGGGMRPQGGNRTPILTPRNFSQPQRDYNAPIRGTINGGALNPGNHDFNNRPAPVVRQNNPIRVNSNVQIRDNVNVYHRRGEGWGYRSYDYHPYHPYYWGPSWHPLGYFLGALAVGALAFTWAGQNYYYNEGVYYQPYNNGYRVTTAPIGAVVNSLPDGYETVNLNDQYYYYYGGIFYAEVQGGFQVIQAPYGAIVSKIPEGAMEQNLNGQNVLVYNNTYFLPISQDGQDAYQVVQP